MTTPVTYGEILAANVRALRNRRGMSQQDLAARMRALGHEAWLHQTVGNVEKCKRRVAAEEILGLAQALTTTIPALMKPTDDDKLVRLLNGAVIAAISVQHLATGDNDYAVQWDGNTPVIPPAVARIEGPQGVSYMLRGDSREPVQPATESHDDHGT